MRAKNLDGRFAQIMIGLFLLLAGLSSGSTAATIVLVLLGLYLLSRQFNTTRSIGTFSREAREPEAYIDTDTEDDEDLPAQPRADQVYAHALDAVRRAGLNPNETHVLPTDIGVMAFSGDQDPIIYRTRPVLDDVDYIQPFVQLRLPTRAQGRIRFEIADSDGQILFVHEADHEFERGRNLVTPAARLPIHDGHALQGDWDLRVLADDVLIAEHKFAWHENTSKVIRRQLQEDGELNNEVRAMMAENRLQKMSLDELLADQPPEDQPTENKQAARR